MRLLVTLLTALCPASTQPSEDYSVADIDCTAITLTARLTKPRGYGGSPVFADRSEGAGGNIQQC